MSSGAEKIVSNINSNAQAKADEIIQEAQNKAADIASQAEKDAAAQQKKIVADGQKQAKMKHQQIISEARMNQRRAELGAKEEVIEMAFDKAINDLTDIASTGDSKYVDSLINMIKQAATEIGGGDLIVQVKEADKSKVSSILATAANNVSSDINVETSFELGESINTIGGAIVKTKNGEIEVNNTIESREARFKKSLRSEVAQILFK
ncbi:V-type ATP synthase subunit E [Methanobrevibacter wolinii]|uniref:V-type ATP synthase subunit E n=1 Tax=Methanobrevibacter wolinii TaxID=190977 RepID=UPI0005B2AB4B|nr:V-type proton ATPase subunit E [Methanobrevibacter wolinii]MDD5959546.1 V-type proton ATPase subunit E [Methanobrevibacter wolinii]